MAINPITYSQLVSAIGNLIVDTGSSDFTAILPQMIQQAENRIYRELDLLSSRTSDTSVTLVAGTRTATCPSTINIVEGVSILTPVGQPVANCRRNVLERTSLDFLDFAYGQESTTAQPGYFAMKTDTAIVFGASPDSAYTIEITGTAQPTAMSNSVQTSYLGNYYPDLLLAASMVFASAWQKDYGTQSDNPQQAQSWESQYQTLFKSAFEETQRQKSQDPNWTPFSPTPLSTPRG